jgi:tRNA(Arg) A34 adenosine deaminase TadA
MQLRSTDFSLALPAWVGPFIGALPDALPTREERVALVNRLADRNWREGNGGPFAALVAESGSGAIVSVGVNVVLASGVSVAHAEVVALGLAQRALGGWDLGAAGQPEHELVVNWRPCVQCYGAAMWSGVRRLVLAGTGPELEAITTFDEGPMREDWVAQFAERGIEVVDGIDREGAIEVFDAYRAAIDAGAVTVYNARGVGD